MPHNPATQADRVADSGSEVLVSGLRWTLWLSVLTAPCGYATSILLARIGPQAIGEYGLLSLYISLTSVFLFLGGPAVAIRFLPQAAPTKRRAFFFSYLAVTCAGALPIQAAFLIWPGALRYFLGDAGTPRFQLSLVFLADLCILFNLAVSALKGFMELKLAQLLVRSVTVASFAMYGALFFCFPAFTATYFHGLIWSIYFGLAIAATAVALRRFLALAPRGPRAFVRLPDGFWGYTLGLQASSVLGFLSTKLDYLFVLNAGGLAVLGKYVALMTLVSIVPMFATFVLDSYLPSLATLLSRGENLAAARLSRTYLRLIILLGFVAISFMTLFSGVIVRILGDRYRDLTPVLQLALPFAGIQIANWVIGTVFSGVGRPQPDAVAKAFRTALFVMTFWPLWHWAGFRGAVWAWGIAEVGYQALALFLLHRTIQFRLPLYGAYIPMISLAVALPFLAGWFAAGNFAATATLWCSAVAAFLVLARYSVSELHIFRRALTPGGRAGDADVFAIGATSTAAP